MAEDKHVVQAFGPYRSHPTFCDRVGPGSFDWRANLLDPEGSDSFIEDAPVATVPVMNEVSGRISVTITGVHDLLC